MLIPPAGRVGRADLLRALAHAGEDQADGPVSQRWAAALAFEIKPMEPPPAVVIGQGHAIAQLRIEVIEAVSTSRPPSPPPSSPSPPANGSQPTPPRTTPFPPAPA